jgi:hypothetical protein
MYARGGREGKDEANGRLHVLILGLGLVVGAVSLGDPGATVLVVLEAGSDDHHGKGTGQHAVDLASDLKGVLVSRKEGGESVGETSVDKVVESDEERSRADNSGTQDDDMAFHKEREYDTDNDKGDNEDGAASSVGDDSVRAPGEDEHGEVESSNGTDGSETEAPEAEEESTSKKSRHCCHSKVDPLSVGAISVCARFNISESNPSECAADIETGEEEGDFEEAVTKESKDEAGDKQDNGNNGSRDCDLFDSATFTADIGEGYFW